MKHILTLFLVIFGINITNAQVVIGTCTMNTDPHAWDWSTYPWYIETNAEISHPNFSEMFPGNGYFEEHIMFQVGNDTSFIFCGDEQLTDTSVSINVALNFLAICPSYEANQPFKIGIRMQVADNMFNMVGCFYSDFIEINPADYMTITGIDGASMDKDLMYPNPTNGSDLVHMPTGTIVTDLTGRTVATATNDCVRVKDIPAGLYLVGNKRLIIN